MSGEAVAPSGLWQGILSLLSHLLWLIPLFLSAGFFSGTETALLSLSRTRREVLRQNAATDPASARVLWLLSDPRRLITTIILGNELTNILLSEVMTDSVTRLLRLFPRLAFGLKPTSQDVLVALWVPRVLISAVSDLLLLVIIGPKGRHTEAAPVLSEREIRTLVDLGQAEGEIRGAERKLIHNVLDFGDLTVGNLMTLERNVFAVPITMPLARIVDTVSKQRYSRVPVYRGRRDNVVGILLAKDLVGYSYGDLEGRPLADLLHPPLFVPKRAKCERLLREFQRRKTHMAMVVDEYGRLAGLVTMEDLLRPLFADLTRTPTLQPNLSGDLPVTGKGEH